MTPPTRAASVGSSVRFFWEWYGWRFVWMSLVVRGAVLGLDLTHNTHICTFDFSLQATDSGPSSSTSSPCLWSRYVTYFLSTSKGKGQMNANPRMGITPTPTHQTTTHHGSSQPNPPTYQPTTQYGDHQPQTTKPPHHTQNRPSGAPPPTSSSTPNSPSSSCTWGRTPSSGRPSPCAGPSSSAWHSWPPRWRTCRWPSPAWSRASSCSTGPPRRGSGGWLWSLRRRC